MSHVSTNVMLKNKDKNTSVASEANVNINIEPSSISERFKQHPEGQEEAVQEIKEHLYDDHKVKVEDAVSQQYFPPKTQIETENQSAKEYLPKKSGWKDKKYTCNICTKEFTAKSTLTYHYKVVHRLWHYNGSDKQYVCQSCNTPFANKSSVRRHQMVNEGKMLPCYICHKMFKNTCSLGHHLYKKHEDNILYIYKKMPIQYKLMKKNGVKEIDPKVQTYKTYLSPKGLRDLRLKSMKQESHEQGEIEKQLYEAHEIKQEMVIGPEVLQ